LGENTGRGPALPGSRPSGIAPCGAHDRARLAGGNASRIHLRQCGRGPLERSRAGLRGVQVAAIISDTFGRPWRLGLTNVAIGAAGFEVLRDLRGARDTAGRRLHATVLACADDLAAAAGLLMEKRKRAPVVLVRGYSYKRAADTARRLIRPAAEDLFR